MRIDKKKYTCAIARSVNLFGDKWSLLILRDIILHKKSRFREFISSKEKIATNVLTDRLKFLIKEGFIEKLNPSGTKKSTQYIATDNGISALPLIIEMYMFSIHSIEETLLNDDQKKIKKELLENRLPFEEKRKKQYLKFVKELKKPFL